MEIVLSLLQLPVIVSLLLALIAGNDNLLRLQSPQPQTSKITQSAKPSAQIEIVRDGDGVAHIRARSEADAQFGLGYTHAQDRLWQMEFQRRLGNGRLSEILGEAGLQPDALFRTIGLRRAASAAWAKLNPQYRQLIEAYVAGINYYLDNQPSQQLPPEFAILGVAPERWQPEDVIVWGKVLAWALSDNWDQELLRYQLIRHFNGDAQRAAQLMPAFAKDDPIILRGKGDKPAKNQKQQAAPGVLSIPDLHLPDLSRLLDLNRAISDNFGMGGQGLGSNNWVLSGKRTTTGKPILANDPHLDGQTPSTFYLAHLSGGSLDVSGATVPGMPGVPIGRNGRISWGVTTANADVQDLFAEDINDRNEALYNGAREPLQVIAETIKVKGRPDVNLRVRISHHGPLISDVINPTGPALALRWTALDPEEDDVAVFLAINRARNFQEFISAFRDNRTLPQNYIYADVDGHIGYIVPGAIPIRAAGDGTLPLPGWTSDTEWKGYVPFEELPQSFDPSKGYISSANNRIADESYPHLIGTSFAAPYRAARIVEMIESKPKLSPDDCASMQADVTALHARKLLPQLLSVKPFDEPSRQAIELLRTWDARMTADSPQAAIFEAWYLEIGKHLFADDLGDELWRNYSNNIYLVGMALEAALEDNNSWCDDVRTPEVETCASLLASALKDGLVDMARAQGNDDIATWQWSNAHHAFFPHNPLDANEQLKAIFSRSIPNGGDKFTVNVGSAFRWEEFNQLHAAAYREIVDFNELDKSRFIIAPGQSGDPRSPHYDDLLERWQRVEYVRISQGLNPSNVITHGRTVIEP